MARHSQLAVLGLFYVENLINTAFFEAVTNGSRARVYVFRRMLAIICNTLFHSLYILLAVEASCYKWSAPLAYNKKAGVAAGLVWCT